MRRPGRFFTHGEVSVLEEDRGSGQVILSVVLPACVMQAVTPQLLGAGLMEGYELRHPLAAWIPTISDAGFTTSDPAFVSAVNAEIARCAKSALDGYSLVARSLAFPGDALAMLPMGTYVRFRLRCSVDKMVQALPDMRPVAGVAELRFAFADVLGPLLERWGRAGEEPPALPGGSCPGSRRRRGPGRGPPSSA